MSLPKMMPETAGFRWGWFGNEQGWIVGGEDGRLNGLPLTQVNNSKKLAFWWWKISRMDANGVPPGLLDAIEGQWQDVILSHDYPMELDALRRMNTDDKFDWEAY